MKKTPLENLVQIETLILYIYNNSGYLRPISTNKLLSLITHTNKQVGCYIVDPCTGACVCLTVHQPRVARRQIFVWKLQSTRYQHMANCLPNYKTYCSMRWLEQRKQMFYITFVLCRLSRYSVAYGIPQESMYHHAKFH